MNLTKNNSGFSPVEILIVVVIVGVISLIGYTIYDRQQPKSASTSGQTSQTESAGNEDIPSAPEINSTEDLTKAEKTLDDTSVEGGSDSSQLDAELASF